MIPGIEEHARQLHAAMLEELRTAIRTDVWDEVRAA